MPARSLIPDHTLQLLNSFGVSATAALYASPGHPEELISLMQKSEVKNAPLLAIGEGTNILFKSDFEGVVLRPCIQGIDILEKSGSHVWIRVGADENWDDWVGYSISRGWFGLENLSLIPGSVGAAPVQNIGAFGVELSEFISRVEALDRTRNSIVELDRESCRFGYRDSLFKREGKNRYIVTGVIFRLNLQPCLTLDYGKVRDTFKAMDGQNAADLRKVIISIRRQKLPDHKELGNAGSFFKNPLVEKPIFNCIRAGYPEVPHYPAPMNYQKVPAAWLIEKAGWKGRRIGNVGTWPSQPLVIVNYGGATGREIFEFSEEVREAVDRKFGIVLEREVLVVG